MKTTRISVLAVAATASWMAIGRGTARAQTVVANPSNYRDLLEELQPGDVLELEAGTYVRLTVAGLHGREDAWITVRGPSEGDPAIIAGESGSNTVQLYDSSFVAIEDLTVDIGGLAVDGINAKDSVSHHIRIENNTLIGFPTDAQDIVGINTKSLAFGWVVRGNTIVEPGTGIYLGNSDGSAPFVDGVIENNVVVNPLGYCMEIKHQNPYTAPAELSEGPHRTVIRHNVFIKDDRESPAGARPNLLVGGFPQTGPGADDLYEVYANLLAHNPREALFQATGRVSIHDNIFVGAGDDQTALLVTEHQGKQVIVAHVYNNTVYGGARGIRLAAAAQESDAVIGNLVFADDPIGGTISDQADNIVDSVVSAADYVTNPAVQLGVMDFYPLPGTVVGAPLDLSAFEGDEDYDRDFNGTPKGDHRFRGAYAGEGDNPGCPLDDNVASCDPAGDTGGSTTTGDTGDTGDTDPSDESGAAVDDGGTSESSATSEGASGSARPGGQDGAVNDDGCTCQSTRRGGPPLWAASVFALAWLRRRVRTARSTRWRRLRQSTAVQIEPAPRLGAAP